MAKKKPKAMWTWARDRRIKLKVPDDLKKEVQTKANELVEKVLTPAYIKPPPKKAEWNYPTEIWTKWHSTSVPPGQAQVPTGSPRRSRRGSPAWSTLATVASTLLTTGIPASGVWSTQG